MANELQTSIRELRRAHLKVLAISLAFMLASLVLVGDLNRHLLFIVVYSALVGLLMFLVHQLFCVWFLESVRLPFSQTRGTGTPSGQVVLRALEAIDRFPYKEAWLSVFLWSVAGLTLIAGMEFYLGITPWQVFVLIVLSVSGGLVDALLGYDASTASLRSSREKLESLLSTDTLTKQASGRLSRRMVGSFLFMVIIALGLSSVVWLSKVREQQADQILKENSVAFQQAANRIEKVLAENQNIRLGEALRQAVLDVETRNKLVVLDGTGRVQQNPLADYDPKWFERIVGADASSWRDFHAPFLYLSRRLSQGSTLMWVGPISLVDDAIGSFVWKGLAGVVLVVIMCLVLAWSVVRSSVRPLQTLSNRFLRLAGGELGVPSGIGGEREISDLMHAVDKFAGSVKQVLGSAIGTANNVLKNHEKLVDRLRRFRETTERRTDTAEQTATSVVEMRSSIQGISEQVEALREASSDCSSAVLEIDQSVREVAASAESLQNQVDDTSSAMAEITVSMEEIVGNVDDLANTAEETVASVAVIDESIKKIEVNTEQTHRVTEDMSQFASRGADSVHQTIAGITQIQEITDEAQEVINRLGTKMEAVGKILTVIGDVAEQTNLLALNAAIIAAAAGEHGKGFAVVADEIKDLADRTSTSTKEISGLIRSVQAESRRAMDAMQRGSGSVRHGVELANNAEKALQQIITSVQQVTQMANDIASSAAEHSGITRSITKSMVNMTAMVRQIKHAMSEQSSGGARVSRVSEQMRDDARFVFRSANEQVQAATGVTKNMERISEMVSFVSKAITEQSNGVSHVARVAEELRHILEEERVQIADLEEIADQIGQQAKEFSRFLEAYDRTGELGK